MHRHVVTCFNLVRQLEHKKPFGKATELFREVFNDWAQNADYFTPTDDEVEVGKQQGKIPAIKAYRARTGAGLGDAKSTLENYFNEKGLFFHYS